MSNVEKFMKRQEKMAAELKEAFEAEREEASIEIGLQRLAGILNKDGDSVHPDFEWDLDWDKSYCITLMDKRLLLDDGTLWDHFRYDEVSNTESLKKALNSVGISSNKNDPVYVQDAGSHPNRGRLLQIFCKDSSALHDIYTNVRVGYSDALKEHFNDVSGEKMELRRSDMVWNGGNKEVTHSTYNEQIAALKAKKSR